jgi:hypothetical protein
VTWSLVPLSETAIPRDSDKTYRSEGARAWAALHSPLEQPEPPALVLQCQCFKDNGTARVSCTGEDDGDDMGSPSGDLVPVLS